MRLTFALLLASLAFGTFFVRAQEGPKKSKEVIPRGQSKPAGPALSPQDAVKAMTVPKASRSSSSPANPT